MHTVETTEGIYVGEMQLFKLEVQSLTKAFRIKRCPRNSLMTSRQSFRIYLSKNGASPNAKWLEALRKQELGDRLTKSQRKKMD